jgi:hypothetical protein
MSRVISVILTCILLGCDAKKPMVTPPAILRPEAEFERLFSELVDTFENGDDKKAASYFASPLVHKLSREEVVIMNELVSEEMKRIGAIIRELPRGAKPKGYKVEGNHGVILVETKVTGSLDPMYLRQTKDGWKFLSGLVLFSNFSFEFDFVESASDYQDNDKINAWIDQQTGRRTRSEQAAPSNR